MTTLPLQPAEREVLRRLEALTPAARKQFIRRLQAACQRRNLYYRKKFQPMGLLPFIVPKAVAAEAHSITRSVFKLQLMAPRLYRENRLGFADLIKLERRTQAWFEAYGHIDPKPWQLFIRPDFGMRPVGGRLRPVLYEFNSCMLGGIYLHTETLEIIERIGLPALGLSARQLKLRPSPHLMGFLRDWVLRARRSAGFPPGGGLAFLESLPPGGGFSELPDITKFFVRPGQRALHGDPRYLKNSNGSVTLRGMPVAFVYRDFSFEDVSGPRNKRMAAFGKLWQEGRVSPAFPSDFDQKGILEMMSSEQFYPLFTKAELRRFKEVVPWTRVLAERKTSDRDGRKVDLVGHTRANKAGLVLKPSWESGGEGILLGPKVTQARWEKAVDAALKEDGGWAVQEYLDLPKKQVAYLREGEILVKECRCTLGVFHDGQNFAYHARVSPKDIVNVAQGGALSAVYLS